MNDEFLSIVTHTAPALLWMAAADGTRVFFNQRWLQFTGRSLEEELETWVDRVHPDDREGYLTLYDSALEQPRPVEIQFRLHRHDGTWRWILERSEPVLTGLVGAGMDITERRTEEEELHRSRDDLRLALAAGNMGTWMWDRPSGRVIRDPNLHAMYGLGVGDLLGTYDEWVALVHPDDRAHVVAEVQRATTEGGTYELEHRIIRPDGTVRWLERRGEAYRDESGAVAGTRGLVIDITERKQAEEERVRLLAAERDARRAAELSTRLITHLQSVTGGLADARTAAEVADVIVLEGIKGLGAASGALCLLADDGRHLEVIRHVGYDEPTMERFQVFSIDADLPASEALRTGEMVLLRSLEERDARYPALRGLRALNMAFAIVPLFVNTRPAGAIALGWKAERAFTEEDRGFLIALSQQAAQALDRADFYEDEHWRAQRQSFLAEASRLLGASFDYETTLAEVARLSVPAVADACSIHLREDIGLRTIARTHADPAKGELLSRLPELAWCLTPGQLAEVATTGTPVIIPEVDDSHLQALTAGPEDQALLNELAIRAVIALPLRSGDENFGVLVVAMDRLRRRRRDEDLPIIEDLAARAAAAIANGRSHQARTTIARTLQHSLLPPDAPLIPGLEVAARYRPVGEDIEVGGDFYDMFASGKRRWGVVVGDVSGKGVLAASLTALARHTVRTAARWEPLPSVVLDVLNDSILEHGGDERFCTIALAFLRPGPDDGVQMSLACGGHPLPLVVDASGGISTVGKTGTAIGLFAKPDLTDVEYTLQAGESLVFYTDGVVEARSPSGSFAEGLLEQTLAGCPGASAEATADAIDRALLEFVAGRPRDDITLVVLRRPPVMFHEHLTPTPDAVAAARQRLRTWLGQHPVGDARVTEDLLLLTSELATNAVRVARTAVDLYVFVDEDRVTVDVADDGPGFDDFPSFTGAATAESSDGRGLYIVGKLADDCLARSGSFGTVIRCVMAR